ncbi:MAG: hypothetical protein K9M07_07705, partial [Simkaniaceae bacterium]|nr:hypothetical protein [Simkaniaceae bacterium]
SNRPEPAPSPAESTDGDQDTASISGLSHRSENDNRSQRSAPASISPSSQSDLSDSIFEQRSQRGDSESRTIDNSPRSSRHSSAQDHDDDFVSLNSNSWTGVGLHPADDNIEEVPSRADALFHDNSRQTPRQPAAASPLSPRSASPESIQENPLLNATNSDLFKALLKHRFTNDLDLVLTYESIQVNATALIDSIKEKLPRATLRGEQGELNELLGQLTEFLSISKTDFEDYLRILKRDGIRKEIINRDTELTVGNLIMIINARHDDDHR